MSNPKPTVCPNINHNYLKGLGAMCEGCHGTGVLETEPTDERGYCIECKSFHKPSEMHTPELLARVLAGAAIPVPETQPDTKVETEYERALKRNKTNAVIIGGVIYPKGTLKNLEDIR